MSGLERLFGGMRSTSMGLSAERTRMDIIAQNIANARTTNTFFSVPPMLAGSRRGMEPVANTSAS